MSRLLRHDRQGMALTLVIVVMIVVGSVVAAASMISGSSFTMSYQHDRRGTLIAIADAGLEQGRATINGNKTLYPDSGYRVLENGVSVVDAAGTTIPGVRRWLYVGPSGITTGQYGVFGTIVSVVEDGNGDRIIRRAEVVQESFAKYAYFTDFETTATGGSIWFANGDQLQGPVHSNDNIRIHSSGAWFRSTVTTAKTVIQPGFGTFDMGYTENVNPIPMPTVADLNKLRTYAQVGNSYVAGGTAGAAGEATTRIEFLAIDLNGDGQATGDIEGFMRIYQSNNTKWVTAHMPTAGPTTSANCGDWHSGSFVRSTLHPFGGHSATAALQASSRRCYLGGSDSIWNSFVASDGTGQWLPRPTTYTISHPQWTALARADKAYLWPLSRELNPNFKGVVFVDGKVAISGTLRARITMASPNNIIIADDVRYVVDPSAGSCTNILGLFTGSDLVLANNMINTPFDVNNWGWHFDDPNTGSPYYDMGLTHRTYEEGPEEWIHGVVLALGSFTAEQYDYSALYGQTCSGVQSGRGCLFLTGGIIQTRRGPVGLTNGRGYVKRYAYDQCAFTDPPPYFPTTGWFAQGRYFEVNPFGFNVDSLYKQLTPKTP